MLAKDTNPILSQILVKLMMTKKLLRQQRVNFRILAPHFQGGIRLTFDSVDHI